MIRSLIVSIYLSYVTRSSGINGWPFSHGSSSNIRMLGKSCLFAGMICGVTLVQMKGQLETARREADLALQSVAEAKQSAAHELALMRRQLNTTQAALDEAKQVGSMPINSCAHLLQHIP
jgi:hypothetical protein